MLWFSRGEVTNNPVIALLLSESANKNMTSHPELPSTTKVVIRDWICLIMRYHSHSQRDWITPLTSDGEPLALRRRASPSTGSAIAENGISQKNDYCNREKLLLAGMPVLSPCPIQAGQSSLAPRVVGMPNKEKKRRDKAVRGIKYLPRGKLSNKLRQNS